MPTNKEVGKGVRGQEERTRGIKGAERCWMVRKEMEKEVEKLRKAEEMRRKAV